MEDLHPVASAHHEARKKFLLTNITKQQEYK